MLCFIRRNMRNTMEYYEWHTAGNFCSLALVTFQSLQQLPGNLTVAAGLGCHKDGRKVSEYRKTD